MRWTKAGITGTMLLVQIDIKSGGIILFQMTALSVDRQTMQSFVQSE